ncbi:ROK family protein [Atopobacter sp. AH10]|uniref:ROK family protein n=1 Tax=Atopobacter sp. AH10 TaxID=2315861 RepID=UPI000EF19139|nr:ROK family protein [Atopobacter sp. AH10]RLK62836.1 ROK family protein [Atopobacter sp. AH10]
MHILAVDIGGTTIKADIYNELGQSQGMKVEYKTPVDLKKGSNKILDSIIHMIDEKMEHLKQSGRKLDGVAISSAGVIDSEKGKVIYSGYTIPQYAKTNFTETIEKKFDIPCKVLNDVNAAACGEFAFGNYEPMGNFVCLTIGTGVGGAILVNGELVMGHQFSAGEVGYLPVNGHRFQDIASTTALCSYYKKISGTKEANGRDIFKAYDQGDHLAKKAIEWLTKNLADGLLAIVYLLNPRYIVLGGGIMERGEVLIPLIEEYLEQNLESPFFMPEKICQAKLGNSAGRLGALHYFLHHQ